jgi:hypothetical protein
LIYKHRKSEPRWINFENPTGKKGKAGIENCGAKGHAWEHFYKDETKVLCDFCGTGIIRRIWLTLSDRSKEVLQGVILKMYWDDSPVPQVDVPLGDFFCMGLRVMKPFENHFFSTAEGRSFCCVIPMPFKKNCKITLTNNSEKYINNLFYDINLTLEDVEDEDMYFCASFKDIELNELEQDVEILTLKNDTGRFLGTSIGVIPNEEWYGDLWWGEGEVKIYLDGDNEFPTLAGTGAEDYIGSAWEMGEFINDCTGCVEKQGNSVSMYRFHVEDSVCFGENIRVTLQTIGGGNFQKVKNVINKGYPCVPVTYDDGDLHHIYRKNEAIDLNGYVNFYRCDSYRVVAYYYKK